MPIRSLRSFVMRWPSLAEVDAAARWWGERLAREAPGIAAVGYFGSYARGEAGVGSDLDLVVIVGDAAARAAPDRGAGGAWATEGLPVPADRLIYTVDEWAELASAGSKFFHHLLAEVVWVVGGPPGV